jgi:abhydrolase domain-containing protein 6
MRKVLIGVAVLLVLGVVGLSRSPALLMQFATNLERGRAGLSEHQIAVDGLDLAYTDGGEGEVILMVHGFNADKDNWTRMAAGLTDDYRVIALDLPGFGRSTRDASLRHDPISQADRLKAFHDALGLSKVHIVGNSMGGEIAGVYTVRYPDDIATLTLIDAAGVLSPTPSEFNRLTALGENPLIASNAEEYGALMDFVFVEKPWVPGVVLDHFAQVAIENREFTAGVWLDLRKHPSGLEAQLSTITAPTLVLWGDTDRVLDVSMAAVFGAGIPGSEVVIMAKTGHLPMVEHPAESAGILREFLARRL